MNLSSVFSSVAHKKLVRVDLPHLGSHQHELNGASSLREFFGATRRTQGKIQWRYFADGADALLGEGEFTFYDARAKSARRTGRTEWHFYYTGGFLSCAKVGDRLFIVKTQAGSVYGLVFEQNSAWLRAAKVLFGQTESSDGVATLPQETLTARQLEFLQRNILSELDLGIPVPAESNDAQIMLDKFGKIFPTTKIMSTFARTQVEVDLSKSDETLIRWLDREEQLFRALENVVIRERLDEGFDTVDDFIDYSLSVQNRRKSRMGFALQNHLAELFTHQGLRFTAQAKTESNNRPDFIFPGQTEYHDLSFNTALLVMLGVKSTSKDRWRQVLDEADRITEKHLCTLEAGISTKQTEAMRHRHLTLVIPASLHATYTPGQRVELLDIESFIDHARQKQA